MTEPRLTVDTINSDQLDALYDQLAKAEQDAEDSIAAAVRLTTLVGKRSELAERAAKRQGLRAELAENELRTLRAGLRANGADPTQIQNLWAQISLRNRQWRETKQRAEEAEAAIDRTVERMQEYRAAGSTGVNPRQVINLLSLTWPDGNFEAPRDSAALDEPKEPTP